MVEITHFPAPGWPMPGRPISMATNDVLFLGAGATGWLHIVRSDSAMARFRLRGGFNATVEELDTDGAFSITKNTALSVNIYYDAAGPNGAGYYIQHLPAATRSYLLFFMGSLIYPF